MEDPQLLGLDNPDGKCNFVSTQFRKNDEDSLEPQEKIITKVELVAAYVTSQEVRWHENKQNSVCQPIKVEKT